MGGGCFDMLRHVVVVGAGPAGLHAAYRLAAAGTDVLVLEAQSRIGENVVCSGVIGEEAFVRFDLPTRPVLASLHCVQAISPMGRKLAHRSSTRLARVVDKGEFNRALGERATAAGVEIRTGTYVRSIQLERDAVVVRFGGANEPSQSVHARVAVLASGISGSLNHALGLMQPRDFLAAIQAQIPASAGKPTSPHTAQVYVGRSVAPGGFGWDIPLPNGLRRVGLMTTGNPKMYYLALLRRIAPELDLATIRPKQKAIAQVPWGRCSSNRVVAVGEAAGHVKTSTGGGIYYGLLSAEFAAEAICQALRCSRLSADTFASYERTWRAAFGRELLVGYFARKLASSLPDTQIEGIFDLVNRSHLLKRLNGTLRFDWHGQALLEALRGLLLLPSRRSRNAANKSFSLWV